MLLVTDLGVQWYLGEQYLHYQYPLCVCFLFLFDWQRVQLLAVSSPLVPAVASQETMGVEVLEAFSLK